MKRNVGLWIVVLLGSGILSPVAWGQLDDGEVRMGLFGPDERYVEPIELTDQPTKKTWSNPFVAWKWRPRPMQWETPEFVQQMSAGSRRMWNSTKRTVGHWASSTNSAIRRSSTKTWNSITRVSRSWSKDDDEPEPPSPQYGGVNEFLSRPKLKF